VPTPSVTQYVQFQNKNHLKMVLKEGIDWKTGGARLEQN
jgi:hypothetical protein